MSAPTLRCDVAIVGGGPAGIAAGTRAAEQGARVVIMDSAPALGGQVWRHREVATLPGTARRWLDRLQAAGAQTLLQATVVDGGVDRGLIVVGPRGSTRVIAPRVILATGARELFLPYPGWTLPNVMGIGGAQAMLKAGLDVRGKRVVIAGSGPLMLPVASAMRHAGALLVTVAEQASARTLGVFALALWSEPAKLFLGARYRAAIPMRAHRTGTWVVGADGTDQVESVTLTNGRQRWVERCDLLCCSYGLTPTIELARLLGCAVENGEVTVDAMQRTTISGVFSAGETTGVAGDAAALAEGQVAGLAATSAPIPADLQRQQQKGRQFARRLRKTFRLRDELKTLAASDTLVCRCEDVRFAQLDAAWTGRQAKLYTRVGMGPCQGAVCGPALEHLLGWPPGSVRPPLFAPSLGAWMAGAAEQDARSSGHPGP